MSTSTNFIKVDVPAGFPPQSTPVKDNERIPDQDIRIEPITKDDLHDVVRASYSAFLGSLLYETIDIHITFRLVASMRPSLKCGGKRVSRSTCGLLRMSV